MAAIASNVHIDRFPRGEDIIRNTGAQGQTNVQHALHLQSFAARSSAIDMVLIWRQTSTSTSTCAAGKAEPAVQYLDAGPDGSSRAMLLNGHHCRGSPR
jgi:hypothetical protein